MMQSENILRRLDQVIRKDATVVAREDFLATHTPFRQLKYQGIGMPEKTVDEEELLKRIFLELPDSHRFVVIRGDQGTGKSHVIRWLKEKYVHYTETNRDVILFITRAENTLRGALEQIIQSEVFSENYRQNELKKLIEANQHLSEIALKRKIVLSFARIASEFGESEMNSRFGRNLFSFMVDETILEFLCRAGGAVERIQKRLGSEESNQRVDDIEPRFFPDDFKIDYQQMMQIKQSEGARTALRLAEALADNNGGPVLRESISKFLNNHLNEVVQECTNLQVSDLKKVFERLRRELKNMGKSLVLFIEDITSFTGIDRALMEVLIQEHTGTDINEQLCRICSIVGVTRYYYNNDLPDNIKDRVTHKVTIDQDSYGDEYLLEMAGRYLNTIYLPVDEVQNWVDAGAVKEDLPISPLYQEYRWAMYQVTNGPELTIFPFNRNAIIQAYARIKENKNKTPRHFLQDIVSFITREFIGRDSHEYFPPSATELEGEFSIPQWTVPPHEAVVIRQSSQYNENIVCLLRLWGDGTAFRRDVDGQVTVGKLKSDVFTAFNLPFIEGVKDGTVPKKPDQRPPYDGKGSDVPPIIPLVNKQEEKFKSIQKELQDWINGKALVNYAEARDNSFKALKEFVDWEGEDVPGNIVTAFTTKRFSIEGQTGQAFDGFEIKRSEKAKFALLALAAWQYLGSRSWNFKDSDDYLGQLHQWMVEVKNEFIASVNKLQDKQGYCPCGSWSVLASYYGLVIGGKLNINDGLSDIYTKMMQPWRDITVNDLRSVKWRELQRKNKKFADNNNFLVEYFNRKQGDVTHGSSVFFLDASEILRFIDEWQKCEWNTEALDDQLFVNLKDEIMYYPLQVLQEIRKLYGLALEEECAEASRIKDLISTFVAGDMSKDSLDRVLDSMREFLALLQDAHESYSSETFEKMTSGNMSGTKLALDINAVERFIASKVSAKNKLASAFPLQRLQPASILFSEFDKLIDQRTLKFQEKIKQLETSSAGGDVNIIIKEAVDLTSILSVKFQTACEEDVEC